MTERGLSAWAVTVIPWVVAAVLLVVGLVINASADSGEFVTGYFAAGDFATGVFAVGFNATGLFVAGRNTASVVDADRDRPR